MFECKLSVHGGNFEKHADLVFEQYICLEDQFNMRIHELRLQNFRRFEEKTVKFPELFSVLVGDNGSGKTTVLESSRMILGDFLNELLNTRDFEDTAWEKDFFKSIDSFGAVVRRTQCRLKADASFEDRSIPFDRSFHIRFSSIGSATISKPGKSDWADTAQMINARIESGSNQCLPLIRFFNVHRNYPIAADDTKLDSWFQDDRRPAGYAFCLNGVLNRKTFEAWFEVQDGEIQNFHRDNDVLQMKVFKSAILEMLNNVHPEELWKDILYSRKYRTLRFVGTDYSGNPFELDLNELSDGYRGVIGMVADMAYRCIQLNPHLGENAVKETPGIVLIDELDLHLHPNWQRSIVADLKRVFPRVQFIAATHSPFIVQSLKTEELIILDEDQDRGGDPRKRSIEDIAETEMGVEDVPRSAPFMEWLEVAGEYLSLISNGHDNYNEVEIRDLKAKLDLMEEDYATEPVFVAMLKLKRMGKGL